MPVPETPVDEYYFGARRKHQVRASRKGSVVQSVPKAESVNDTADYQFDFGVLRAYSPHNRTTFCSGEYIRHLSLPSAYEIDGGISINNDLSISIALTRSLYFSSSRLNPLISLSLEN